MPATGHSRKRKASVDVDELYRESTMAAAIKKEAARLPKSESLDERDEEAGEDEKSFGTAIGKGTVQEKGKKEAANNSLPLANVLRPGSHCPAWLGTHKNLQAAIASVDDRLLFLRICEELETKGIRYEQVCVEPLVGGHMLKLTDLSALVAKYGVDYEDFFKNLLHCNIRLNLPDGSSQMECTFTNPPLVQDFERSEEEVETERKKPQTWIRSIGTQHQRPRELLFMPLTSQSQLIAHCIEERMLTYCRIYVPVRRFAQAYRQHFHNFCSVRLFNYHKLLLAYGDDRDLFVVLSWRWHWHSKTGRYALCFGQTAAPNKNGGAKRHWNPHVLVSQLLVERFNRDRDLTWLVNYLVNTHHSLGIIHGFVRAQMQSNKIAAQILGTEAAFPAELTSYLVPLDENIIRLTNGPQMAMEFMLLQENQVAVRDCSSGTNAGGGIGAGGANLADFWRTFQTPAEAGNAGGSELEEEIGGENEEEREGMEGENDDGGNGEEELLEEEN